MPKKLKEGPRVITLREVPSDVNKTIVQEQKRLSLFDDLDLKKDQVIYRIVKEWRQLKNEKAEEEKK